MKTKTVPTEEIQRLLKSVFDDCQQEDNAVRERQIRNWRRLKLLWEGFTRIWYSEVAHDWRIWDETADEDTGQAYYDKQVNVFKAYLESIIAALSIVVPPVKCYPDDADNTLDLATAKAGDKIGQLIYRHNNAGLLWLHALFIFVTEGMTACYSYPVSDKKYGTWDDKEYDEIEEENDVMTCSVCGYEIDRQEVTPDTPDISHLLEQELDEFQPGNEDAELHRRLAIGQDICPACAQLMDPHLKREKFITTRLVGITKEPKTRICLEVYGGLYVKVANYAKTTKDTPYLIFSHEEDYSITIGKYEHLHGKVNSKKTRELIAKMKSGNQSGGYNQYEQWGRLSPQYMGEYPLNVVTINEAWIRPAKFNILPKEDADKLKKLYPDGAKVVIINDEFAEACNASLDDYWTLSENPLSDFLYFDPLGQSLTSIQEITNDLISLVLQTIEHGIGQTFADPAVVNFNAYAQTEVTPGGIFPATPKSGKSMNDGFHEIKTAQLSGEVLPFSQNIQSLGQLVSGALPSLFGGNIEGGETASQYSMSRAQALQRLQNVWKMQTTWWKTIFGKVIPMYINEVKEDERDVQKKDDGNFVNVLIRKAELEGKIGKVELEANENLPLTWSQTKDTVEKLMQNANPEIMKIISAPENTTLIHDALGLVDFYVPGEDDVIKQYDEIKLLLASEPIQTGIPENPEESSIPIDPIFDNNEVEFGVCRKWIISEEGRQTKTDNEAGYRNVILHGLAHYQKMQENLMMQAEAQQEQGAAPGKKPKQTDQEAPILENSDVQTIQ